MLRHWPGMTRRQRWTLVATIIGSGAVFLDGTIVSVALKRIGQELPASLVGVLEGQAYVVSGYLAVLAALLILAGALSDHYGRRRVYAIGLAGFALTSALCGLAPTLELLVVFRLLQGAAGALLIPGSLALITHAFEGEARGRAFGIWAASTSALTVIGPIVGGIMVDTIGWRFAFLINVPLLAFALWATLRHVEESKDTETSAAVRLAGRPRRGARRRRARVRPDPRPGARMEPTRPPGSPSSSGSIALVLFPILMATRPNPLVPLGLFRLAGVRDRQPRHVLRLRRAVRDVRLPAAGPPGRARLHGPRRRADRPPERDPAVGPVHPGRDGGRPGRGPPVPRRRAADHGRRRCSGSRDSRTTRSRGWPRSRRRATLIPPLDVLVDVLPAIILFGIGISLVVAPLTSTLMGSIPGRFSGLGLGDQQLDLARRPAAPRRDHLHRDQRHVLLGARDERARPGHGARRRSEAPSSRSTPRPPTPRPRRPRPPPQASMDAFHLAILVCAVLLVIGTPGVLVRAAGRPVGGRSRRPSPPAARERC